MWTRNPSQLAFRRRDIRAQCGCLPRDRRLLCRRSRSTAARFVGRRQHHVIPNVGHNLPQEAPNAVADAVLELVQATA